MRRLRAEIGVDHRRIAHHLFGRAFGDRRTVVQHENARGERHDRAHHMLDQQNGEPGVAIEALQDRHHAVGLGRAQARHHLVEQQEFRIGGQRARNFQPLAVGQRQRRGALPALVVEVEAAQHLVRPRARVDDMVAMQAARRR